MFRLQPPFLEHNAPAPSDRAKMIADAQNDIAAKQNAAKELAGYNLPPGCGLLGSGVACALIHPRTTPVLSRPKTRPATAVCRSRAC